MSGRFFAMPLLVSAIILVSSIERREIGLVFGAGLLAYNVIAPLVPVKTRASYDGAWAWRLQNGVKDERGHYHQITNVLFYAPFGHCANHVVSRGHQFSATAPKRFRSRAASASSDQRRTVEICHRPECVSDPLLARLPVSESLYFEFYDGHFFRDSPRGIYRITSRRKT